MTYYWLFEKTQKGCTTIIDNYQLSCTLHHHKEVLGTNELSERFSIFLSISFKSFINLFVPNAPFLNPPENIRKPYG